MKATNVRVALDQTGTVLEGTLAASGTFPLGSSSRRMGPLAIEWTNVVAEPSVDTTTNAARVLLTFDKLKLSVAADPLTAIAVSGQVELSLSGTRIVQLQLVEPYPL